MTQPAREQAPSEHIEAFCTGLSEVLRIAGGPLARVRINLGGAELEIDWPQAPAGTPIAVPVETPVDPGGAGRSESEEHHAVRAPLVGTFYTTPEPGADPFVTVGHRVDKGETVCIIEAMKLMNHVVADVAGTVVAVHVDHGASVEFDQRLVSIDPDPTV